MRYGITLIVTLALVVTSAVSAWSKSKDAKVAEMIKDATVTIDQAIKTGLEKVPGTVVEAEIEKKHGKTVWEVEILGADGKMSEVHIDAATGAVIDVETKKGGKKGK